MSFLEVDEASPALAKLDFAQFTLFQMDVASLKGNLQAGNVKATIASLGRIASRVFGEKEPDALILSLTATFPSIPVAKTARAAVEAAPKYKPMISVPAAMVRAA